MKRIPLNKVFAVLPISLVSVDYALSNGIKPELAIILALLYWVGVGQKYVELSGLKANSFKLALMAWFWPVQYYVGRNNLGETAIGFYLNGVKLSVLKLSEFTKGLTDELKNPNVIWCQIKTTFRSLAIAGIVAVIVSPLAILSITVLLAYLNKSYMWDLIERWRDGVEPMKEALNAIQAAKLFAVALFFKLMKNEFYDSALNKIRIARGIPYSGKMQIKPETLS